MMQIQTAARNAIISRTPLSFNTMPSSRFELAIRSTESVFGQLQHFLGHNPKRQFDLALHQDDSFFNRVNALIDAAHTGKDTPSIIDSNATSLSLSLTLSLLTTTNSGKGSSARHTHSPST